MSLSDKDMDQLFQNMDEKASFAFKDAYWTEMEELLNAKKSKKRLFWWMNSWVLIPGLFVFTALGAVGVFAWKDTATASKQKPIQAEIAVTKGGELTENTPTEKATDTYKVPEKHTAVNAVQNSQNHLPNSPAIATLNHSEEAKTTTISKQNKAMDKMHLEILEVATMTKKMDLKTDATIQGVVLEEKSWKSPKSKWTMYVGAGLGMATNIQRKGNYAGAGMIRFEYGAEKWFNRFYLGLGLGVENTFGTSLSLKNKYISYDFVRKENEQNYAYNRFTNFYAPIRLGISLDKKYRNQLQLMAIPVFSMYNNLVYSEFSNGKLVAKDEFFNQDLGLKRLYMNLGISYNFALTNNLSIGLEYHNNFGTNRKNSLHKMYALKADHQFIVQLRYYIR